eukprot:TRINITY_DN10855_c0_g2_i1.p2 TRINITY_DN10855_c0_g2~~TRINITY_DN10855_c0_g2_i1.p2  ORF type:complete len:221 (-),score=81.82 TRINITY_DN10855_c0_g2_i1:1345-2007(-)
MEDPEVRAWPTAAAAADPMEGVDVENCPVDQLQEHLRKLELENAGHMAACRALEHALDSRLIDQGDAYYYLHKKLDDNFEMSLELERLLVMETTEREVVSVRFQKRADDARRACEAELAPLHASLLQLEEDMAAHQEVAVLKREMEARRLQLQRALDEREERHLKDMDDASRKGVQERERLRREVARQIEAAASELQGQKEQELRRRAKRAFSANQKLRM